MLRRQIRWGHLSVTGTLHNLAFSNVHQKKKKKKMEECLSKCCIISFETLVGKNKKEPIHGLKRCSPMAFEAAVLSASWRILSPGEVTTGCCKENMKFLHHTSTLGLVLIFFPLLNYHKQFYLRPPRWFELCGCRQYPWEQNRCEK